MTPEVNEDLSQEEGWKPLTSLPYDIRQSLAIFVPPSLPVESASQIVCICLFICLMFSPNLAPRPCPMSLSNVD